MPSPKEKVLSARLSAPSLLLAAGRSLATPCCVVSAVPAPEPREPPRPIRQIRYSFA